MIKDLTENFRYWDRANRVIEHMIRKSEYCDTQFKITAEVVGLFPDTTGCCSQTHSDASDEAIVAGIQNYLPQILQYAEQYASIRKRKEAVALRENIEKLINA